jgi:DNA-binding Lrp family transcriptional regulator
MRLFTDDENRLLQALEEPLPLVLRPFEVLAERTGLKEEYILSRLSAWVKDRTIRRFGARINHYSVGYAANGLCVWQVHPNRVEETGKFIGNLREVSHCYKRRPAKGWNYNLYAMIHGKSREEVLALVERVSKLTGLKDFKVIFSTKEMKKTPPKYFEKTRS